MGRFEVPLLSRDARCLQTKTPDFSTQQQRRDVNMQNQQKRTGKRFEHERFGFRFFFPKWDLKAAARQ